MKLDKNKVYDLSELTSEERKEVEKVAKIHIYNYKYLLFSSGWFVCSDGSKFCTEPTNAKELFYTLENVQVDCRGLSEEQIKEMAYVFESNGYINSMGLNVCDTYFLLRQRWGKEDRNFGVLGDHKDDRFTTITYEKFMELFAEPQYEVKYIAEKPNDFKQITDSIASLLQYKNEKYGNSALEPLNVFQGKCKVGQRLDDKLARVKNNKTLQKNDVADLIGYLFLICKENNWTNFDEFKD